MTESVIALTTPPLKPTGLAYANYRFRAVIDWIELRIVTTKPSNFDTVMKRIGASYVAAIDKGPGGAATEFIARIQDPTSWASIAEMVDRFTVDHPLAESVAVTGIEIALDAYSRRNSRDDLVEMVARFYKFATKMVSANRRLSKGRFDTEGIRMYPSLVRRIAEGYNIYVGDRGAEATQHLYVKETETVDGQLVHLNPTACRARTEFTLRGAALPYTTLTDWQGHDFTSMADFFKYRQLKPCLTPLVGHALRHLDQVGERRERATKGRRSRFFSKSTMADNQLNALAYSALRELTKRMNG